MEIPGRVLLRVPMSFRSADSKSDRDVVQIFSEDEKHLVATAITVPRLPNEPNHEHRGDL